MDAQPQITRLLIDWKSGNRQALDQLAPLIYQELRRLAAIHLKYERPDHTLQPTALIHEAYLRLVDQTLPDWKNRTHFFAVASQIMRQVLVDFARSRKAVKRGGGGDRIPLEDVALLTEPRADRLLELDRALESLQAFDERKCRVIELRYFGGLSREETAEALGLTLATVKRDLMLAEAYLRREMGVRSLKPESAG
jgi:RNA polymerase sigma-70 factor, ECF subfamily